MRRRLVAWCVLAGAGLLLWGVGKRLPAVSGAVDAGREACWQALVGAEPHDVISSWDYQVSAARTASGEGLSSAGSGSLDLVLCHSQEPPVITAALSILGCCATLNYQCTVREGWRYELQLGQAPPPRPDPRSCRTAIFVIPRPPRGQTARYRWTLRATCQKDARGRRTVSGRLLGPGAADLHVTGLPAAPLRAQVFLSCRRECASLAECPLSFGPIRLGGRPANLTDLTGQSWNPGCYRLRARGDRLTFCSERPVSATAAPSRQRRTTLTGARGRRLTR